MPTNSNLHRIAMIVDCVFRSDATDASPVKVELCQVVEGRQCALGDADHIVVVQNVDLYCQRIRTTHLCLSRSTCASYRHGLGSISGCMEWLQPTNASSRICLSVCSCVCDAQTFESLNLKSSFQYQGTSSESLDRVCVSRS